MDFRSITHTHLLLLNHRECTPKYCYLTLYVSQLKEAGGERGDASVGIGLGRECYCSCVTVDLYSSYLCEHNFVQPTYASYPLQGKYKDDLSYSLL
jgi:hypothetical protein